MKSGQSILPLMACSWQDFCHSPKNIRESIAQAEAAIARGLTILSKDQIAAGGIVAKVEPEKCAACLTCVRVCPYSVPVINEKGEAERST